MTESYTFEVSDVDGELSDDECGDSQLAKEALAVTLGTWREPLPVEAMSNPTEIHYGTPYFHGLISAVHRAFDQERRLELAPDHIWLTITQGFARHINENAEDYRQHFVKHEGKKLIEIRRDEFIRGSADNDWPGAFSEFSAAIKDEIGERNHSNIVSDFTTTDDLSRAVSEIVLMDAMQSYFRFQCSSMCGIPEVTLEGTADDWNKLVSKVEALREYGELDWWLNDVRTIVEEMAAARAGKADKDFWRNIYNFDNGSGGPHVSGWITRLVPYLPIGDGQVYIRNKMLGGNFGKYGPLLKPQDFPRALSRVPFVWKYHGSSYDYEFIGGLTGVTEVDSTSQFGKAVRPVIGWAVRPTGETED